MLLASEMLASKEWLLHTLISEGIQSVQWRTQTKFEQILMYALLRLSVLHS